MSVCKTWKLKPQKGVMASISDKRLTDNKDKNNSVVWTQWFSLTTAQRLTMIFYMKNSTTTSYDIHSSTYNQAVIYETIMILWTYGLLLNIESAPTSLPATRNHLLPLPHHLVPCATIFNHSSLFWIFEY